MKKEHVIVGGGLVGCILAIILKKKLGFDVTIFEKRLDPRLENQDAGRSINLIITNRGLRSLDIVDLKNDVLKITTPVYGRMMHDHDGNLTYQPYGKDKSEYNNSVSRSELNCLLMSLAENHGIEIIFDSPLKNYNIETNTLEFPQYFIEAKHVYGTDGAASLVRKSLIAKLQGKDSVDYLERGYKELFMPAQNGNYAMEKKALHIWPRGDHMLMALPNLNGSFTMTLYCKHKGENSFDKLKSKEDVIRFFESNYLDATKLMPNYVEEFLANPEGKLGTVSCSPWNYDDKCVLLGDAAHAIVPFLGQGMNAGFEDCRILMEEILNHENLKDAFDSYTKKQKPNADAIADMALENFLEMRDKVGDKDFLAQKKLEKEVETQFPQLYRSRYAMIIYSHIPYAICKEVGRTQQTLLESLRTEDNKNWQNIIEETMLPIIEKFQLDLNF